MMRQAVAWWVRLAILTVVATLVEGGAALAARANGKPAAVYRFAIFEYLPAEILAPRFAPLGPYLSSFLPQGRVEVVVLDRAALDAEIEAGRIDFVLTNPTHYMFLLHRGAVTSPQATMVKFEAGVPTTKLGGLILVAPGRDDIQRLEDLRGRRIAYPGVEFLGGYQTQAYELYTRGIRLPRDAQMLQVGNQRKVVEALLNGEADVGFVRSGVLEEFKEHYALPTERLRILVPRQYRDFPHPVSTRLYPEWPVSSAPHVPEEVRRHITRALLLLDEQHPVARSAKIAGFTSPENYEPVEAVLRALRLPPFDQVEVLWEDVWNRYWLAIVTIGVLTSIALVLAWLLWRGQQRLRRNHAKLADALEENRAILEALGEGVYGIDRQGRCTFINASALQMLGVRREDVIGQDAHRAFHKKARDPGIAHCYLHEPALAAGQPIQAEDDFVRADGTTFSVYINVQPLWREGEVVGAVVAFHDISRRLRQMQELEKLAAYDELTGLANRRLFLNRLKEELARLERVGGEACVFMMDVDHFKEVNDTYGHAAGDRVLRMLADVVEAQVRTMDLAGRLGGEEFACLLPQCSLAEALSVAERVREGVARARVPLAGVALKGTSAPPEGLQVTISIGVTLCLPGDSAEAVLHRADEALYRAKVAGRNRVAVASSEPMSSC